MQESFAESMKKKVENQLAKMQEDLAESKKKEAKVYNVDDFWINFIYKKYFK